MRYARIEANFFDEGLKITPEFSFSGGSLRGIRPGHFFSTAPLMSR